MGSFYTDDYYGWNRVARPTFLSLSSKRNGFSPTLPRTPEHGISHESLHGTNEKDIGNWDILTSSGYADQQEDDDDDDSDVFVLPGSCEHKAEVSVKSSPSPQAMASVNTQFKFSQSADGVSERTEREKHCCSEWIRAYFSKLWNKNGSEPLQSETPISTLPRPCTILERESTLRRLSPKRMRRLSKKRLSAASSFIYAAFLEDTVIELREERHEDVVYSITVKKDGSLQRNGSLNKSFMDDDSVKERNTSRHMKGATLDFMVDRLAEVFSGENDDVNYLNVFLTTYRTFATPEELFRKLKDKYMQLNASPLKDLHAMKSIIRVFRAWLERYFLDDFQDGGNSKILNELYELAKLHDDITNQNEVDSSRVKSKNIVISIHPRSNGLTHTVGFTDLVAAKIAVATKSYQSSQQGVESPQVSPSRLHNPDLTISESSTINTSPAKTLLNEFSSTHVATQLTVIAAKLFHRVKPHHCLATVTSPKSGRPQTVRATINQFNKVVYCVIGTVLCPCLKLSQRTKLLTKWIEVAQECRELKNFSSLRAIVSGLQTHSLHRLKKAWAGVPQSHMNLLTELAEMNMKDLLMKVGTAKVNTEDSAITRVRKEATIRREQDMHSGIMHGTVPYLGSFLTDLTYLDTARPNFLEGGLINFEKRRKEFELLAQLQLWQASCRSYQNLTPDDEFMTWFQSITVLSEEQSFAFSEIIEPPLSSVSSPTRPMSPAKKTIPEMIHAEVDKNTPLQSWQKSQRKIENGVAGRDLNKSGTGRINVASSPCDKNRAVRIRLIRKHVESGTRRAEAGVEYKTISISSDERRAAVIKKALESFMLDVEEYQKKFSLVQLLHDKQIQIPDTANVFYAMSSSDQDPTLLLLEDGAVIPHKAKRHQSTPNRTKKTRHRKNASLTYTHEPESGRASPSVINAKSPMKALFSQLAFNSVAIAGSSYSISDASSRRSSEGDSEVAGSDGVVLTNSRSGIELVDLDGSNEVGVDVCLPNITNRRTSRCYSADYGGNGVILPVRVVRSSRALSSSEQKPITMKSAPASPHKSDRKYSSPTSGDDNEDHDVITATGRLTEWPRYSASASNAVVGRSSTWSSRRAMRRPRKTRHSSTFYVSNELTENNENAATTESAMSRNCTTSTPRPQTLYTRSSSARTLPGRFLPDFSGHDYEDDDDVIKPQKLPSSHSFDSANTSSPPTESTRGTSFASDSSGESNPNIPTVGLSFTADIYSDARNRANDGQFTDSDGSSSSDQNSSSVFSTRPPLIKVQSPSPKHVGNESGFFDRYSTNCAQSDSDSSSESYRNVEDIITVL